MITYFFLKKIFFLSSNTWLFQNLYNFKIPQLPSPIAKPNLYKNNLGISFPKKNNYWSCYYYLFDKVKFTFDYFLFFFNFLKINNILGFFSLSLTTFSFIFLINEFILVLHDFYLYILFKVYIKIIKVFFSGNVLAICSYFNYSRGFFLLNKYIYFFPFNFEVEHLGYCFFFYFSVFKKLIKYSWDFIFFIDYLNFFFIKNLIVF